MGHWSLGGSEEFGDFDPVAIIDHDNFTASDLFLIGVKNDGTLRGLVQLDDRAWRQLQNIAHGHLTRAKLDGQFDPQKIKA